MVQRARLVPERCVRPRAQVRHEKHVQREMAAETVFSQSHQQPAAGGPSSGGPGGGGGTAAGPASPPGGGMQQAVRDVEALYKRHGDLGLKDGQTIK